MGAVPALLGGGGGSYNGVPSINGYTSLGVVGVSFKAPGEASFSKNWEHRPGGGDGESSPRGGPSIL